MTDEQKTAERLARIETNLEQIGTVLKELVQDHERRLRIAETQLAAQMALVQVVEKQNVIIDELRRKSERQEGVLKLIGWLGAPTSAAVIFFLAKAA